MFREPSRHDKVLRKTAGGDAGDGGGYSTYWTTRPDMSIDRLHLWVLQKDLCGQKWSGGCREFELGTGGRRHNLGLRCHSRDGHVIGLVLSTTSQ
jgi:hypothetical protein